MVKLRAKDLTSLEVTSPVLSTAQVKSSYFKLTLLLVYLVNFLDSVKTTMIAVI